MELKKPNYLISLSSASVVVNVEVNVWSATKQDRAISDEVTDAYKAHKDAGRFVKNLLAGDPTHKKLLLHRQSVYNWMKRWTYDWSGSNRLLPFIRLEKFKAEWAKHEQDHKELVQEFVNRYPDIVAEMAFKQGELFKKEDYPGVNEIGSRFAMRLSVMPVPESDFRVAIANDIAEDLKSHYENTAQETIQRAMRDASEQLLDYIKRIAHACSDPTEEGKRKPKVYESTISSLKELINMLGHFNITQDETLEAMRKEAQAVIGDLSAEDIRDSEAVRSSVKDGMDSILSKFGITLS
jgi:hypothetical protein